MKYISKYSSPIGKITLAGDGECLTGLWFDGQKYFGSNHNMDNFDEKELSVFEDTKKWLDIYFSGNQPNFTPCIKLMGTDFQLMVWDILLKIPYGEVITYKDIACRIAQKKGLNHMSAQAVGSAVGHNPISIIVPCHRVIGSNGSLTGYAGGLDKKEYFLHLEKALG